MERNTVTVVVKLKPQLFPVRCRNSMCYMEETNPSPHSEKLQQNRKPTAFQLIQQALEAFYSYANFKSFRETS